MRCKACDSVIEGPKFNRQLNDWELCPPCLEIVFDTFNDYDDDNAEILADDPIEEALRIIEREQ